MEDPASVKVAWIGHGHTWPGTSGTAWNGEVTLHFAGTDQGFGARLVAARSHGTKDWLARVPSSGKTAEARLALHAELRALGLLLGEPGDALDRHWVAGRGRTRDEAARQAAVAAWLCACRGRDREPEALIAGSRARREATRRSWAEREAREKAAGAARELAAARGGLGERALAELLRLDAEGLLDGSNALSGLKAIADELRGLGRGADEARAA